MFSAVPSKRHVFEQGGHLFLDGGIACLFKGEASNPAGVFLVTHRRVLRGGLEARVLDGGVARRGLSMWQGKGQG